MDKNIKSGYLAEDFMLCKGLTTGYGEPQEVIGYFYPEFSPKNVKEFIPRIIPYSQTSAFEVDSKKIFPATRHYDKNNNVIFEYDIVKVYGFLEEKCCQKMAFGELLERNGSYWQSIYTTGYCGIIVCRNKKG